MKILKITRSIDDNFRQSSDRSRCINSLGFLTTTNFEKGISQFNKLAVEADLYLVEYSLRHRPIYLRIATKTIEGQDKNRRLLRTKIFKRFDDEFTLIREGEQKVELFYIS